MNATYNTFFSFRAHQWWKYALAPALGWIYFLHLISATTFGDSILQVCCLGLSFLGMAALGYFLNDWSDEKQDRAAGKANTTTSLSVSTKFFIAFFLVVGAVSPWFLLTDIYWYYLILVVEILLFVLYSFTPVRLKEKGWAAPITDALYAHVLPSILFMVYILTDISLVFLLTVGAWKLVSGTRYYFNHIALDLDNDIKSNTQTLATKYSVLALFKWNAKYILPLEILLLSAVLCLGLYNIPEFMPLAFLLLFSTIFYEQALTNTSTNSFFTYNFSRITLDDFYQKVFPLANLAGLVFLDAKFGFLIVIHLVLFHGLLNRAWSLMKGLIKFFFNLPYRQVASKFVNYTVYYFRKIVLQSNEQQARKNQYAEYVIQQQQKAEALAKHKNGRVAVVNINKAKYTETFIHGMVQHLPFEIHQLFGGELPTYSVNEGDFINESKLVKAWINVIEILLAKPEKYFLKKAILSYLYRNNIQVVLAEFGPVGANLTDICKQAGIPLVVHFHGYDAYHKQVLQQNLNDYHKMFDYSNAIIAVSKEMKQQLIHLGADESKVFYQPDFVNLSLYRYVDVSNNSPICLAIGRFAETKSPHLTILAFKQVLDAFPSAKLIMVGKDGGGELFEACHILVKSLGIEDAVEFKGVLTPIAIYELMKIARIFVQHSLTTPLYNDKEGTPVAIMEASAAGLPIVATRHAGINDVVIAGETGILVDEYDVDAMAKAMIELLQDDKRVKQMGEAGSRYIHSHPQISTYISNMESILKKAIIY